MSGSTARKREFHFAVNNRNTAGVAVRRESPAGRVLFFAPPDVVVSACQRRLEDANIPCLACDTHEAFYQLLEDGVGAAVTSAEYLSRCNNERLREALSRADQSNPPAWIILSDAANPPSEETLDQLNAVLLSVPVPLESLQSAIRFALRASPRREVSRQPSTKLAESAEQASLAEARLRAVQELSLDAFSFLSAVRDDAGRIVDFRWDYLNPAAARILGRSLEELIGQRMLSVLPEGEHAREVFKRCVEVVETAVSHELEVCYDCGDGTYGWFRNAAVKLGEGVAVYYSDITERKRAEEELRALNETLEQRVRERTTVAEQRAELIRALARKLTQTEQRERKRLARLLHDHLQQLLVAARLKSNLLRRKAADDSFRGSFDQIESLLNQAIDAARSLTVELCPPILYESGLVRGLQWLAGEMHENYGLSVNVEAEPDAEPEAEELRILLFESVRELLFNVVKHAKVNEAQVTVTREREDQVRIEVSDRGAGFQLQERFESCATGGSGCGLVSLRERLQWMRGEVSVESSPGAGTRVTLIAPRRLPPGHSVPMELLIANAPASEPGGPDQEAFVSSNT